jgi:two-component system nitrate/nitrite response regulator NarL
MKIMLAAPGGWATDALCGLLKKLDPGHAIEMVADPQSLSSREATNPEFILLDVDASRDAPGLVAIARHRYPRSHIIGIGTSLDNSLVEAILEAGALGYLPKNLSETVILGMLRMIIGGIGPSPAKAKDESALDENSFNKATNGAAEPVIDFALTTRQTEVLALAAEGKTNQSIAKQLGITEGVVKLHMTAVFKALKVRNRSEAVLLALRLKSVNFRQVKEAEGGRLDLDWLLAHMTHQHVEPETVLFKQGDPGRALYYLQRGTIRLPELDLELKNGAMFGEIGIFSPTHKRTATAVCLTSVEIFTLTSEQVKRLYLLNPQFALYLVHLIAKRLMADQTRTI